MAEPRPDKYGPIEVEAPTHTRPPAVSEVLRPGEEPPKAAAKSAPSKSTTKRTARKSTTSSTAKSAPKGTDTAQEG